MEINTYESEKDKLGANELEEFQDVSKEQVDSDGNSKLVG